MAASKLVLRPPPSLILTLFLSSNQLRLLSTPASATLSICRRPTSAVASLSSQSQTLNSPTLPLYGPSLRKGSNLPIKPRITDSESDDDGGQIDEESFKRVFDVSAIRVPAKDCFLLEERLRGHLLNWPRIRNIARVPGDDVEKRFLDLATKEETTGLDNLERRMYGRADGDGERLNSVLYRDKLVKSFDSNGFVNFKNVVKMSGPLRRKKKVVVVDEKVRKLGERNKDGRNGFALVEVVEDADGDEGGNWSGLLGDDCYRGVRWKGPTRLLLLDESYANKGVDELPEAIKVVLSSGGHKTSPAPELVRCKLTLFYSYWQMDEILEALLPDGMVIPSAFEMVGHIAHLNLRDEHLPYKKLIAKVVYDKHSSKIQTVVNKTDAIQNNYRTMQLEVLAGNHSLVATVVENGLRVQVDLATVYWNSRLATERQRLVDCFTRDDVVCDVFAGVGPIALAAAKKVKRVYANDLNPQAVEYMERNCVLNKLERRVKVFNMDGRRFIHAMFTSSKAESITQVVMNLPGDAAEYLDVFKGIYRDKPKGGKFRYPTIHVYAFSKAEDPEFDFEKYLIFPTISI
uniref:tRNA (guanine(37)-N1)-methyltransferase n=1 Tax=Kalanchoe fedtschenkoi TaxID=63787 RepID=A0A7N0V1L0_KALFE